MKKNAHRAFFYVKNILTRNIAIFIVMFNDIYPVKKFPTSEELIEAIREFEDIQWEQVSKDDLENVVPWPLKAMSIFSINYPLEKYIYRARSFHSFPADDLNDNIYLPQSFSYPPPEKARMNRANYKGEPIFYAASNLMAAIVESQSDGHLDFVSCWKIKPGVVLKIRPYISNLAQHIKESNDTFIPDFKKQYDEKLTCLYDANIIRLIDEFQDKQFIKQIKLQNEYLYTAWLAYKNIFQYKRRQDFDQILPNALMYQCTKCDRLGTNLAIDKDFVDTSLILDEVFLLTHTFDNIQKKARRLLLSCGKVQNNLIAWRQPDNEDLQRFSEQHDVSFYARESG